VVALAKTLMQKNPTTFMDPERGRDEGMRQFLDEKSYKPGLGAYKRKP
jgi:trans-feruloyl-CoA hydratase/vanillin synthase